MDRHGITKLVRSLGPLSEADKIIRNGELNFASKSFDEMLLTIARVSVSLSADTVKNIVFPAMAKEAEQLMPDSRASSAVINTMFGIGRRSDESYPEFKVLKAAFQNCAEFLPKLIEEGFYPNKSTPNLLTEKFLLAGSMGAYLYDCDPLKKGDALIGYAGDGTEAKLEKIGGASQLRRRYSEIIPDKYTKSDLAVMRIENMYGAFITVAEGHKTPKEGAELLGKNSNVRFTTLDA